MGRRPLLWLHHSIDKNKSMPFPVEKIRIGWQSPPIKWQFDANNDSKYSIFYPLKKAYWGYVPLHRLDGINNIF